MIFYSLLSGSFISLDEEHGKRLQKSDFSRFTSSELETLKKAGFVCDNDTNEVEQIYNKRKEKSISSDSENATFTIMTTSACNARCYYCYEKGILQENMTEETANRVVEFIVKKSHDKPVSISWFGGEPLFNKKIINIICTELKEKGLKYTSSMITNGLLVNQILEEEISLWNFREVQITLDAIGKKYNQIKNYNCEDDNPFVTVINGIKYLIINNVRISIRLNFNPKTINETLTLIDWVYKEFGPNEMIKVYVANIVADGVILPNDMSPNPYIILFKKLMDYGYLQNLKDFKISPRLLPCSTEHRNYYVISPIGKLYKCEHMVSKGHESFGDIFSNKVDQNITKKWENIDSNFAACYNCICLPICQGGCKAYRFERDDKSHCLQIKNCLEEIVKLCYQKRFKNKTTFKDIVLYAQSKTGKDKKTYRKYIKDYLSFQKSKNEFVGKNSTLKLDSQFSESLAADVFFFDINHKNGYDGEDPITNNTYEVKGTGVKNDRVRFSKTKKAIFVIWVKVEWDKIVITKIDNNVYNATNKDGFVNLKSYLKNNRQSLLKEIVIFL